MHYCAVEAAVASRFNPHSHPHNRRRGLLKTPYPTPVSLPPPLLSSPATLLAILAFLHVIPASLPVIPASLPVIPAQAGIQLFLCVFLDPRLRGDDIKIAGMTQKNSEDDKRGGRDDERGRRQSLRFFFGS